MVCLVATVKPEVVTMQPGGVPPGVVAMQPGGVPPGVVTMQPGGVPPGVVTMQPGVVPPGVVTMQTGVVHVQSMVHMAAPQNVREFSTGLCDCCSNMKTCK